MCKRMFFKLVVLVVGTFLICSFVLYVMGNVYPYITYILFYWTRSGLAPESLTCKARILLLN